MKDSIIQYISYILVISFVAAGVLTNLLTRNVDYEALDTDNVKGGRPRVLGWMSRRYYTPRGKVIFVWRLVALCISGVFLYSLLALHALGW